LIQAWLLESHEEKGVLVRGGVLRKRREFNTVGELNEFRE
jgi:hypothetical protein